MWLLEIVRRLSGCVWRLVKGCEESVMRVWGDFYRVKGCYLKCVGVLSGRCGEAVRCRKTVFRIC